MEKKTEKMVHEIWVLAFPKKPIPKLTSMVFAILRNSGKRGDVRKMPMTNRSGKTIGVNNAWFEKLCQDTVYIHKLFGEAHKTGGK